MSVEENREDESIKIGRTKLGQVFRYLKALHERRYPPVRTITGHPFYLVLTDVPTHECAEVHGEEYVLRIRRPALTPGPPPPENLQAWIDRGWENPAVEPAHRTTLPGEDPPIAFEDDVARVAAWKSWREEWRRWAPVARDERRVEGIYQSLYEQHSILEREGERFELLLGDGFATWSLPEGPVVHPLLLKSVELTFDAKNAEFHLIEGPRPVELYTAPLRSVDVDPRILSKVRDQVEDSPDLHPLGEEATDDFLRGLAASLDPNGRFVEEPVTGTPQALAIFRNPTVFRRLKVAGIGVAIEQALEVINGEGDNSQWSASLPQGLLRMVGVETREASAANQAGLSEDPEEDEEIYFTKPANLEQYRLVRKLDQTGCVLVQGPPGTGKTHTIGNLVGHLLAQGKSVLVTSHTTKALSVLRNQVVEPLQPLCVSVLTSDRENRELLEASVQRIAERLTQDGGELPKRAEDLRANLIAETRRLKSDLRAARRSEYESIYCAGTAHQPVDAAKIVAAGVEVDDWIPGTVSPSSPLPLSHEELLALYETNETLSPEDEANHPEEFPDVAALFDAGDFAELIESLTQLRVQDLRPETSLRTGTAAHSVGVVSEAIHLAWEAAEFLAEGDSQWKRMIVELSRRGQGKLWEDLADDVDRVTHLALDRQPRILRAAPHWKTEANHRQAILACREIEEFLTSGKKLTSFVLLTRRAWKETIESLEVADGRPATPEHFAAARESLEMKREREELVRVWNGMLSEIGGPLIEAGALRPEQVAQPLLPDIRACVGWHAARWPLTDQAVTECGLSTKAALLKIPLPSSGSSEVDRLTHALRSVIVPELQKLKARIELAQLESRLGVFQVTVGTFAKAHPGLPLVQRLAQTVEESDALGYAETLRALREVHGKTDLIARRRQLLRKLGASAPEWAQAIRLRLAPHHTRNVPSDAERAWTWKQLDGELTRRAQVSVQDLVSRLDRTRSEGEVTTARLVETLAWSGQFSRVTLKMRQSLMGYVEILRKIGKGTGRRVPRLQIEARRQMSESQGAVPVWIMPLSRVVESFDLRKTKFDVVIIDEASQLDLTGLIALFMAKQVVIVGDHEQVEPLAVGQNLDDVQALIDEMLDGIPSAQLWDGRQSVYSLAKAAFEPVALREHFRCVPQIIGFSNRLSYRGEILPLREDSGVPTRPFVVEQHVPGAFFEGKINRREAETVVALMKAAMEQPEYDGRTFGAINLVGEEDSDQTRLVYSLARTHIGEFELERRRFRCGNSAQFQGDQRHVMFLSVVDVPKTGLLPKRENELFKKRYNVAASRAQDQMWVVHSLDPNTDLQADDLRRSLIEFARTPDALDTLYADKATSTESDFERRVLRCLIEAGYLNVQPQYPVGAYRIDIVVGSGERRVAVECDGDRYHGLDELDADMARQATLERLGWKFIRIRGSEFYRAQGRTMDRVFHELTNLGISPDAGTPASVAQKASSDLLNRVRRRADELLRQWRRETSPLSEEELDAEITEPDFPKDLFAENLGKSPTT